MGTYSFSTLAKLYGMYMHTGESGVLPHAFGPPGVGKTETAVRLAKTAGVNLHVMNLASVSPLEVRGVDMPHEGELRFLTGAFWTNIKYGDIVLFDECLRAFPETFNGILDLFTSREINGYKIPRSFWLGASNSIATYDPALEDRLLHLPVPDIRTSSAALMKTAKELVAHTGMHPDMIGHYTTNHVIQQLIAPTYTILDDLHAGRPAVHTSGMSVRKLIAQINLREFDNSAIRSLIAENNTLAANEPQYQIHTSVAAGDVFVQLLKSDRLTKIQRRNAEMHVDLAGMYETLMEDEKEEVNDEDDIFA